MVYFKLYLLIWILEESTYYSLAGDQWKYAKNISLQWKINFHSENTENENMHFISSIFFNISFKYIINMYVMFITALLDENNLQYYICLSSAKWNVNQHTLNILKWKENNTMIEYPRYFQDINPVRKLQVANILLLSSHNII